MDEQQDIAKARNLALSVINHPKFKAKMADPKNAAVFNEYLQSQKAIGALTDDDIKQAMTPAPSPSPMAPQQPSVYNHNAFLPNISTTEDVATNPTLYDKATGASPLAGGINDAAMGLFGDPFAAKRFDARNKGNFLVDNPVVKAGIDLYRQGVAAPVVAASSHFMNTTGLDKVLGLSPQEVHNRGVQAFSKAPVNPLASGMVNTSREMPGNLGIMEAGGLGGMALGGKLFGPVGVVPGGVVGTGAAIVGAGPIIKSAGDAIGRTLYGTDAQEAAEQQQVTAQKQNMAQYGIGSLIGQTPYALPAPKQFWTGMKGAVDMLKMGGQNRNEAIKYLAQNAPNIALASKNVYDAWLNAASKKYDNDSLLALSLAVAGASMTGTGLMEAKVPMRSPEAMGTLGNAGQAAGDRLALKLAPGQTSDLMSRNPEATTPRPPVAKNTADTVLGGKFVFTNKAGVDHEFIADTYDPSTGTVTGKYKAKNGRTVVVTQKVQPDDIARLQSATDAPVTAEQSVEGNNTYQDNIAKYPLSATNTIVKYQGKLYKVVQHYMSGDVNLQSLQTGRVEDDSMSISPSELKPASKEEIKNGQADEEKSATPATIPEPQFQSDAPQAKTEPKPLDAPAQTVEPETPVEQKTEPKEEPVPVPGYRGIGTPRSNEYEKKGGWKLHLTVDPKNYKAVDDWLAKNHDGQYKLLSGGEAGEKDFTVYVGSRDDANGLADKINKEIGDKLLDSNAGGTDTIISGKVAGRFDIKGTEGAKGRDYYGTDGVPYDQSTADARMQVLINKRMGDKKNEDVWSSIEKNQASKLHEGLVSDFGDFYTGSKKNDFSVPENAPGNQEEPKPQPEAPPVVVTKKPAKAPATSADGKPATKVVAPKATATNGLVPADSEGLTAPMRAELGRIADPTERAYAKGVLLHGLSDDPNKVAPTGEGVSPEKKQAIDVLMNRMAAVRKTKIAESQATQPKTAELPAPVTPKPTVVIPAIAPAPATKASGAKATKVVTPKASPVVPVKPAESDSVATTSPIAKEQPTPEPPKADTPSGNADSEYPHLTKTQAVILKEDVAKKQATYDKLKADPSTGKIPLSEAARDLASATMRLQYPLRERQEAFVRLNNLTSLDKTQQANLNVLKMSFSPSELSWLSKLKDVSEISSAGNIVPMKKGTPKPEPTPMDANALPDYKDMTEGQKAQMDSMKYAIKSGMTIKEKMAMADHFTEQTKSLEGTDKAVAEHLSQLMKDHIAEEVANVAVKKNTEDGCL